MQALNPLLVMLLIPFNNLVLYPALKRLGWEMTALRRMTAGIAFSAFSWLVIGWIQVSMDGGTPMSILWQLAPYALLTMGEVLVSATGLEFAYSQAPASMKGCILCGERLKTRRRWPCTSRRCHLATPILCPRARRGWSTRA